MRIGEIAAQTAREVKEKEREIEKERAARVADIVKKLHRIVPDSKSASGKLNG